MDIFYPDNVVEVIRQMLAFFCWFFAARLGWRYADWLLSRIFSLWHRKKP